MTTALNFATLVKTSATRRAFGRAVRKAREELDMTEHDLAVEAETDEYTVAEVEGGFCQSRGVMRRVSEVLGIEPEEIE